MNALEIKNLNKSFPGFDLKDLNLTLPGGCIMGLVGENGAGKSTTIRLILDMLHKDSGSICVFGKDHLENTCLMKEDIGVVLDHPGFPGVLNAYQIGKIMAGVFRNWKMDTYRELLEKLRLPEKKPFKDFSRGMKMKLGIAIAMSHDAKLLLLDEATGGLDPVVRDEVVEMFREFVCDEEHAILVSSHIVSDLEKLCDYVAFLHKGELLLCEEKDLLLSRYGILHCTREQFAEIPAENIKNQRLSPYGMELMVMREGLPAGLSVSPISIEELFVFMVKEA